MSPKGFFLQIMQIIHIQTRLIRMLYIPKCGESYSIRPLDPNVEIGQVIQHQSRIHFCRAVLSAYNYEFVFSVCSVYEYDWNAQPAVMRVCVCVDPPRAFSRKGGASRQIRGVPTKQFWVRVQVRVRVGLWFG